MLAMEANHDEWAGFWVSTKTEDDADSTTNWLDANTYRYMHVMVYKDRVSNLKFKLEGSYTGTVEKYATNPENGTNSGTEKWEDIVIDFEEVGGFAPIWLVSPNWDDPDRENSASVVYVDNIVFNNDAEPYTDDTPSGLTDTQTSTLRLFPNPVSDKLYLDNITGNRISVINILGQQLMQFDAVGDQLTISMNNLTGGIYYVLVRDKSGIVSCEKVLKK
jgi:hypothetical protein